MKPCKYLDHEGKYVNCELVDISHIAPGVKHWRGLESEPFVAGKPVMQLCRIKGSIDTVFGCYCDEHTKHSAMPCFEHEIAKDDEVKS